MQKHPHGSVTEPVEATKPVKATEPVEATENVLSPMTAKPDADLVLRHGLKTLSLMSKKIRICHIAKAKR